MSRPSRGMLSGLVMCLLSVAAVDAQPPADGQSTSPRSPPSDADRIFRDLDANRDGVLTLGEGGPGIQQMIRRLLDMARKPQSGSISLDEFRVIHAQHVRSTAGAQRLDSRRQEQPVPPRAAAGRPGSSSQRSGRPTVPGPGPVAAPISAQLQGTWQGWVVDGRGENPNTGHMQMELRVEGQRMVAREIGTSRAPGGLGDGTFVVVGTAGSGTLDAVATSGQHPGKEYPGIFELEGDTLRWCVNNHNRQTQRPAAFETGRGFYYMVLRRQAAD